jgi:hypothetical protein
MRRMLAIVYAVSTVVLAGCGSDSSTDPTQSSLAGSSALVGTWNLTTVGGIALPFVLQDANPKVELLGDRLVLSVNGTFTQTMTARFSDDVAEVTRDFPDFGTYALNGASATFRFSDGTSGSGTLLGNSITVGGTGTEFVYQRQ